MAFDPDAYLASKQGFDPDAYLAASNIKTETAPEKAPAPAWGDVPLEAVKNFPGSVGGVIAGQAEQGANIAGYALPKIAQFGVLAPAAMMVDAGKAVYQNPSLLKDIPAGIWHSLVEEYGSDEALRRTIASDPAKVALDASILVSGGRAAVNRVGRAVGEIGRAADVARPFHEIPEPPPPPPPAAPPLPPAENVYSRAGIEAPRALTGPDWQQQAALTLAKQPTLGGAQIGRAVETVPEQMVARRGEIAGEFGAERSPGNVGADIRSTLEGQATAERTAAEAAAAQADAAARAQYEGTIAQRTQQTADLEAQSARETSAQVGPPQTPTGMGEHAIEAVRDAHHEAVTRKNALYADAGARQGTIYDTAMTNLHGVVVNDLRGNNQRSRVTLGPPRDPNSVTPQASEMNRAVIDFTTMARNRRAAAEAEAIANYTAQRGYPEGYQLSPAERATAIQGARQTGVTLREFDDFRKDLTSIYGNIDHINKPADARAANRIMGAVDTFQERAMGGRHFEGDREALPAIRRARAANTDLMNRFGYNHNFDEDKILQRIVRDGRTDHIGPNNVFDLLAKEPDKAGRVLDRIFGATGHNPQLVQSIRSGLYEHAARPMEAGAPRTSEAIAKDLTRLTTGKKEGLANRIYQPQDIALIQRHATALRTAERARERTGEIARTTVPEPTEVVPGEAQQRFQEIVGNRKDEALLQRIHGFMTSKRSSEDVRRLAATLHALPENTRGNVLNAFIRDMGTGADGKFSPKQFADAWQHHIPGEVKFMMTGGASPHVQALDNLAAASREFVKAHQKYGNITGSGHTANYGFLSGKVTAIATAAATGNIVPAITLGGAWLGAVGMSKFLASPAGASSAAKFARQLNKLQSNPTVGQAAATQMAARNMRNTAVGLGIPVTNFPVPGNTQGP